MDNGYHKIYTPVQSMKLNTVDSVQISDYQKLSGYSVQPCKCLVLLSNWSHCSVILFIYKLWLWKHVLQGYIYSSGVYVLKYELLVGGI